MLRFFCCWNRGDDDFVLSNINGELCIDAEPERDEIVPFQLNRRCWRVMVAARTFNIKLSLHNGWPFPRCHIPSIAEWQGYGKKNGANSPIIRCQTPKMGKNALVWLVLLYITLYSKYITINREAAGITPTDSTYHNVQSSSRAFARPKRRGCGRLVCYV